MMIIECPIHMRIHAGRFTSTRIFANRENSSQSLRRHKNTNVGEHSAARISCFGVDVVLREVTSGGTWHVVIIVRISQQEQDDKVAAPWHDKQSCSSVFWNALSQAVGYGCDVSCSWESSSWGPRVQEGPIWSRRSRSVLSCADVLCAQSDGPMYSYVAWLWLAAFFFPVSTSGSGLFVTWYLRQWEECHHAKQKSMTLEAQDKNDPNKSMASGEHEWWQKCLERWLEAWIIKKNTAEHRIHTLHRGSRFFKGVFCVGRFFDTCVRCHAARGISCAS